MPRDQFLYIEDLASAGEAVLRYIDGITFERFANTDDKRVDLDRLIDTYEHKIGPRNGARVVASAWVDPAYRQRLLIEANAAMAELGYGGMQGEQTVVLENSPTLHNMTVCTLCACYPWPLLGLPPVWYKSAPYRSRSVIEPRAVLREFGLEVPDDVEVRVWDSTAELRYLVLPERPAGTDGWTEEALAAIVTRDSMNQIAFPMPRHPQRTTCSQACHQLSTERTAALHIERLVNGLVGDPHRLIIREVEFQPF